MSFVSWSPAGSCFFLNASFMLFLYVFKHKLPIDIFSYLPLNNSNNRCVLFIHMDMFCFYILSFFHKHFMAKHFETRPRPHLRCRLQSSSVDLRLMTTVSGILSLAMADFLWNTVVTRVTSGHQNSVQYGLVWYLRWPKQYRTESTVDSESKFGKSLRCFLFSITEDLNRETRLNWLLATILILVTLVTLVTTVYFTKCQP